MFNSVLTKVRRRLARDSDLPLAERLQDGVLSALRYAAGAARGAVVLSSCNKVGKLVRTPGGRPHIENRGEIELGSHVVLTSTYCPVRLTTGPKGKISIGDNTNINFGVTIAANNRVVIGRHVSIGPYTVVSDSPFDGEPRSVYEAETIEIGDNVWLAGRVTLLPGTRIHAGSVITAGSIVSGEIPSGVVAGGNPARVLRSLDTSKDLISVSPRGMPENDTQAEGAGLPSISTALRMAPLRLPTAVELEPIVFSMPPPSLKPPANRPADYRALVISDFTINELADLLGTPSESPVIEVDLAPYQPVQQTLLTLSGTPADLVVVWGLAQTCLPSFQRLLANEQVPVQALEQEVDAYTELLGRTLANIKCVVVPTWTVPSYQRGLGVGDLRPGGVAHALLAINQRLITQLGARRNFHVLNTQRWVEVAGPHAQHPKLWYLGKVAYSREVFEEAAHDIRAAIAAVTGRARKLVIVDLDDTLWGGIVGDIGWEALRLGGHDSQGEAFADFQRTLKNLTRRGILLGIVSKNEESVALDAIRKHSEMVLREKDFAGWRINWQDKARNVADLAQELNLGLQSVVFLDDNPVERARVREALPEVFVPEWPEDKHLYASTLRSLRCFDTGALSDEDLRRTEMMQEQRERDQQLKSVGSIDEWIASLKMRVVVEPLSGSNLPRAAQLLNKTNQMNLSTRRLTDPELQEWAAAERNDLYVIHVADRFGDSGLTGIVSLEADGSTGRIVDYLLSCRVMARKLEELLLHIAVDAARRRGLSKVQAKLIPTAKNKPCLDFLRRSGFIEISENVFEWDAAREYPSPQAVDVVQTAGAAA